MPRPGGASEYLVGRNPVREVLRAGRRQVSRVLVADGVAERGIVAEITALARQAGVAVAPARREELDRLGGELVHQGVAAQVSPFPYVSLDELLAVPGQRNEPAFFLALDSIQDVGNLGALLRTAEAAGVHGIILPERHAASITPAVSRASAGAAEHLAVAQVTNLVRGLQALEGAGGWVVGGEDHPKAGDYRGPELNQPLVLVLGSEGQGMRRLVAETCDLLLRLPMRGQVGSLNVAVAGGILIYHLWAARQEASAAG
jgi:23S rRNA (guanosine2251-2'-O)-methyltransferase